MSRIRSALLAAGCVVAVITLTVGPAWGQPVPTEPTAFTRPLMPLEAVARVQAPSVDLDAVEAEDDLREIDGLPPRFAIPNEVWITPDTDGTWEDLDGKLSVWRLRVSSRGAASLNLGFTRYVMPEGGVLFIYATDDSYRLRPYTSQDNKAHGELWTPVVLADDIVVEVTLPPGTEDQLDLELGFINVGYRGFGDILGGGDRQGYCNIDVICPQGDGWRDEIQSVAAIQRSGSMVCTGFMVNNTAEDETPYFMTAYHCGVTSSTDSTLVCYWNFVSPNCGDLCCGSLSQNQSGSTLMSSYYNSDFTLVLLDDDPDPSWDVTFAGWERSSSNPTSAVCIHHPGVDEKAISFEDDACTTTSYLSTSTPGDGTHIRVIDWDLGTTEGGSSGSPLFDQNHHVVGQLHGGYAACGNDDSDWYGRFSISWSHGLSSYLDPLSSGVTNLDTLVPGAAGLKVTPSEGLVSSGDTGGPFTPSSKVYTLENQGSYGINYTVSKSQSWVSLNNTGGYLPADGTAYVTVSINSNANSLPNGGYADTVNVVNTTDHLGDTSLDVSLQVGVPSMIYSFPMDTNPGWTTTTGWEFGQPTGGGGEYGYADPTSGHTGSNVYGYNLDGDYESSMPERHLTSTAIDCSELSAVSVKFWRWLGVERNLYDHAYFRVSNNGTNWTEIWANGSTHIEDSSWSQQEYDISSIADGQATVYLRWTMGTTDTSWQYCGWNIDDVEIWGLGALQADTTPPTPDPMTFSSSPAATGTSAIAMTATLATDAESEPVEYYFDFVSGGSGGNDSGWQSSRSFTDYGLSTNTQYTYRVKARDSADTPNETAYSSQFSAYTLAAVPAAPSLSDVTETTMVLAVNANGNPSNTQFAIQCASTDGNWNGKYVSATGAAGSSPVWRTQAQWGSVTVGDLLPGTQYCWQVRARNGDNIETAFGPQSCQQTGAVGIYDVYSCHEHGSLGEVCLSLRTNYLEPRSGSVSKMLFDTTAGVSSFSAAVDCKYHDYNGTITETADGSSVVTVEFDPALPNNDCCTVTLTGEVNGDQTIAILLGDADGNFDVNSLDYSYVKLRLGLPVLDMPRVDLNADGDITSLDYSTIKLNISAVLLDCP